MCGGERLVIEMSKVGGEIERRGWIPDMFYIYTYIYKSVIDRMCSPKKREKNFRMMPGFYF